MYHSRLVDLQAAEKLRETLTGLNIFFIFNGLPELNKVDSYQGKPYCLDRLSGEKMTASLCCTSSL